MLESFKLVSFVVIQIQKFFLFPYLNRGQKMLFALQIVNPSEANWDL